MTTVQKIKQIGKIRLCSDEDFNFFLPNYPVLKGSEFIFTIGWANCKKYIDEEIEWFVKGLHIIEEKYKAETSNDFGFGGPSPSFKVVQKYAERNYKNALELEKWIALNGGNYYVESISKPDDFCSKLQAKSLF